MDTIDVSNLNRQFLFRPGDVGASKAETAAKRVAERVSGVVVTPHHCRIEDKPHEWYRQFHIIVLGLDSLEARSYMNAVACSFFATTPTARWISPRSNRWWTAARRGLRATRGSSYQA